MALSNPPALNDGTAGRYVKLNVGGSLFCTTLDTLCKQGSHMLAAMFSGRMEVQRDADGFVNIDRDGSVFRYVLNHLRDGETVLPASRQERRLLLAEARFYALQSLVEQIIREDEEQDVARCRVAVIRAPGELQELVGSSKHGKPVVVFVYNRSNNKFSYTGPSDDSLLKNIALFDKISIKFHDRITYAKDTSGDSGHICSWFFYGSGRLLSEVCCTAMVYSSDKKQTKIEFPEARLWEENMNVLLHERGCEKPAAQATDSTSPPARARAMSIPMALTDTI